VKISSRKESVLGGLLVKANHQKFLALFLGDPAQHLCGQPTEISKKVRVSIGQTSNILNDLLQAGVVEKKRKG
jgi:DNA-binding MarR family transcriptional regulator